MAGQLEFRQLFGKKKDQIMQKPRSPSAAAITDFDYIFAENGLVAYKGGSLLAVANLKKVSNLIAHVKHNLISWYPTVHCYLQAIFESPVH